MSSLERCLFSFVAYFIMNLFVSLLWICSILFYVYGIFPLSYELFENISFYEPGIIFFSVDLFTCCVDGFSLVQSYLMVFVICTFDVLQKKALFSSPMSRLFS